MGAETPREAYRKCLRVLAEVARACRENGGNEGWAAVSVAHTAIRKLLSAARTGSGESEGGDGRARAQGDTAR